MTTDFGILPSGLHATLYTISWGGLTAAVTDYGATLVRLLVPDRQGKPADVVLGYDDVSGYAQGHAFFGATVGRNANRIRSGRFRLDGETFRLRQNGLFCSLHSGPDYFHNRLWQTETVSDRSVTFLLHSPHGDQGFPGNAQIRVTYTLEAPGQLRIRYDGICDRDTVFNMTNHSYFNLAGQDTPERAASQILMMPARFYTPTDRFLIPTGQERPVDGTPMDFRSPRPLEHPKGYDHNFEVRGDPCALLWDPVSGRAMAVSTDCPGIQLYTACGTRETGKGGVFYGKGSGVCLETQYFPDALHHPRWAQPITKAGSPYRSETSFRFSVSGEFPHITT